MGNAVVKASKFGKAALLAALTTPFVFSIAIISFYRNRHNHPKALPERRKSVRFNDNITMHESSSSLLELPKKDLVVEPKVEIIEVQKDIQQMEEEKSEAQGKEEVESKEEQEESKLPQETFHMRDSAEMARIHAVVRNGEVVIWEIEIEIVVYV
jgi:hypothetical protein